MMRIITISIIILFYQALQSQVLNNGFETLNSQGKAVNWISKAYFSSVILDSSELKQDSILRDRKNYAVTQDMVYSGKYALELRNDFNVTKNLSQPGQVFASSDSLDFVFANRMVQISQRPVGLNFQGMYLPKDGDTATVILTVYNANSEVIGEGILEIGKTYSKFNKFNLLVDYTSSEEAAFYSLQISCAKEGNRNSVGTVLYVDEIELLNETAIEQAQESSFKVFPNPSSGSFKLEAKQNVKVSQVQYVDMGGKTIEVKPTSDGVYWTDNLDDGIYIVMVRSNNFVGKYKLVVRR